MSSSSLPDDAAAIVATEESLLTETLSSLREQLVRAKGRFIAEEERSRELTTSFVTTTRAEDKQLVASDEAVSHALKLQGSENTTILKQLLERPYFARVVLEEQGRKIEYRIGKAANPDCRIVDWRRAPISKLYYEYREGDEYSEIIQGRERNGTVQLRHGLDINKGVLTGIRCRVGDLRKERGGWQLSAERRAAPRNSYGEMPELLPLITPEQFRLITSDHDGPLLIQGIAGSGKTAVAIHRLAWLIEARRGEVRSSHLALLVASPILRHYVERSLRALAMESIPVLTLDEWWRRTFSLAVQQKIIPTLNLVTSPTPHSILRLKGSAGIATRLEEIAPEDPIGALIALYQQPGRILAADTSKLLTRELIVQGGERTKTALSQSELLEEDLPLLVRLLERRQGGVAVGEGWEPLDHVVVDEVQDLDPVSLGTVCGAVRASSDVTLVGDIAQRLQSGAIFPGWDAVLARWKLEGAVPVTLTVNHRSTKQIMQYADQVLRRPLTQHGREGRKPIWFHCRREELGVEAARKWLTQAIERYPNDLTVVLALDGETTRQVYQFLRPTFGDALRLGTRDSFSFEEGILVTTVDLVKGLEFRNVQVWNPHLRAGDDLDLLRSRLHIACTRAEENLSLVSWGATRGLLPSPENQLHRYTPLGFDEEEEPATREE